MVTEPKSTPLKRAPHINRISFISVASYALPLSGERKNSPRHWTANYEAARFSQLPQWRPIIFQTQKVTWWRVTGHFMYGYKFFMFLCVFQKSIQDSLSERLFSQWVMVMSCSRMLPTSHDSMICVCT